MKKLLLILITLSVLQTTATAQVDLSVFSRDQIWLFANGKENSSDGIILCKNGDMFEYQDAKYSKDTPQKSVKALAQPKAVIDVSGSLYCSSYKIDKKKQLFYFSRSDYAWRIQRCANDTLILQRTGKAITKDFDNWDWRRPKKLVLLREKRIKSTCLPVLDTQRDTEINSIREDPYCGVIPFNSTKCKKFIRE
jgi:hypothetical protein